ncbi:TonB-dependent receptor [Sphingomonas colocasiae]|uniref:TonB-dependent receptor n=1 Tax=Sphingomonas colocasiae TaxID=1848973 RepID=A0ABS7PTC5_9SPHN|nr:TonB-dependent receptor [Sphingomonas colocasiae]MBY8823229.1 TonB-dependent receptor [Sphingomonas colocasiae]
MNTRRHTTSGFAAFLMSCASPLALLAPASASAQEASQAFDIPAQPLASAILEYSRQSNRQVAAPMELVRGKHAPALKGSYSAAAALEKLLEGSGLSIRKGSGTSFVIAASAAGNVAGASGDGSAEVRPGRGTIVGSLNEATTGAALKGARVEIEETGDVVATDELGNFRFANVRAGDVTLRVSYLGYPATSMVVTVTPRETASAPITLAAGQDREIIVMGQVSARAQALNQERMGENSSTIVSGDLLGNFNGTTISDALRRAPGISFLQNADTGDGTNIVIRGLSPDYNQVKLNGIALPESSGIGRSADLSALLADSVSEIRISKTLSARQDSAGTGGLVEIETKSPLDRPKRYFNVSVDGTRRAKGFGSEYSLSGTASLRFGASDNFGISASYQRRKQDARTYAYGINGIFGAYLPLNSDGTPAMTRDLDPRVSFPFYEGGQYYVTGAYANYDRVKSETSTYSVSSEWKIDNSTSLRMDYNRSERAADTLYNAYGLSGVNNYSTLAPVAAEGGALRYIMTAPVRLSGSNSGRLKDDDRSATDSVSFRGKSVFGALTLDYRGGYSRGASVTPGEYSFMTSRSLPVNSANVAASAIDPATGTIITAFGPRIGRGIPQPLLTAAGLQLAQTPGVYILSASGQVDRRGRSENKDGEFNARYDFQGSILKYIDVGVQYTGSYFKNIPRSSVYYAGLPNGGNLYPLAAELVEFETVAFDAATGANSPYNLLSEASIRQFLGALDSYVDRGLMRRSVTPSRPLIDDMHTKEDTLAGYVQLRADIGRVEIIPGLRINRTRTNAAFANSTTILDENSVRDDAFYDANLRIFNGVGVATDYLPRLLVNFRPSEALVFRGGYFSTVARPQISQLNSERGLVYYAMRAYGPGNTQPLLGVSEGNPNLKPAWTHNFDVGLEWYDKNVGVLKLNMWLKRISNLIESNAISDQNLLDGLDLPDHPVLDNLPSDVFITWTRPVNNPKVATIWGGEVAFEKRLNFLPGFLSGLGVYLNYTYSKSEKTWQGNWPKPIYDASGSFQGYENIAYFQKAPFDNSPKHSGTAGLTYSGWGLDASLFFSKQSRMQTSIGSYNMGQHEESFQSLDFQAVYNFKIVGAQMRFVLQANDLLRGPTDAQFETTIGGVDKTPKYYTGAKYHGGRRVSAGISATF